MPPEKPEMISVGKILGTHGIKGQVKVMSLSDNPDRFNDLSRVYIAGTLDNELTAHVESVFNHKGFEIVKFREWDNINDVEGFKDCEIQIPKEERPSLPEGEYYHDEITGMIVKITTDDILGEIKQIYHTGANDVYLVSSEQYGEFLLPALKHVVKQVNLQGREMIVDLPEGLLEEDENNEH